MSVEPFIMAFIAGTTLAGLAGSVAEMRSAYPARMGLPFLSADYPLTSLLRLILAGPYFLVGEAIGCHKDEVIGWGAVLVAFAFAALWCLASGIICLEVLWQLSLLF